MVRTVLLVDDDQDDQYVFKDALGSVHPSVKVETACDGVDALNKLASGNPLTELIFVDLNMPRMNGKAFLKEIKASLQFSSIPIIIYSTSSNPDDISETRLLGARDFITKPDNYNQLCKVLDRVLLQS